MYIYTYIRLYEIILYKLSVNSSNFFTDCFEKFLGQYGISTKTTFFGFSNKLELS